MLKENGAKEKLVDFFICNDMKMLAVEKKIHSMILENEC